MNRRSKHLRAIAAAAGMLIAAVTAGGDTNPVITSFNDGMLTWSNINHSLYYSVQWRPSLTGTNDWTGSYRACQDLQSMNPTITAPVPVFYRVSGTSNAAHTRVLSPNTSLVEAGYYEEADMAQVDADLVSGNVRGGVTIFGVSGKTEVVDTTSGDAVAADIRLLKKGWVDGTEVTGTLAGGVSCTGTFSPGGRWCDNGDGTVTDTSSGLVWLKNAGWIERKWRDNRIGEHDDAHTRAGLLESGEAGLTDGSVKGDWRLATKSEFETMTSGIEGISIASPSLFTNIQSDWYWTSTTSSTNTLGQAYVMKMVDGNFLGQNKDSFMPVWPVRSGH